MACVLWVLWVLALLFVIYKALDRLLRLPRIGHLDKRYIFITGCDTGFGNATAKTLDALGCHVFAACLTEKGGDELKKSCSDRLKTVHLDVSSHDNVLKAFDYVKDNIPHGMGLWGVLNNAGILGALGSIDWCYMDDYKKAIAVNLYGVIDVSTTFLPLVRKAHGRIVNTASIVGRFAFPGCAPYSISKFGVESFSDCLRRDMKVFGVSVHIIEPGFHRTNILDAEGMGRAMEKCWNNTAEHVKVEYGEEHFQHAKKALTEKFLASPLFSSDINGVVEAYIHALIGLCPRARYMIGIDAKFVWLPLQWLPEWLCDWLLMANRRHNGAIPPAGAVKK